MLNGMILISANSPETVEHHKILSMHRDAYILTTNDCTALMSIVDVTDQKTAPELGVLFPFQQRLQRNRKASHNSTEILKHIVETPKSVLSVEDNFMKVYDRSDLNDDAGEMGD